MVILLWSGEPGAEPIPRRRISIPTLCDIVSYNLQTDIFSFYSDKFILMCLIKIHDNQPMNSVIPPLWEFIKLQFKTDTLN